jgi:hypothetical protein
MENFIVLRSYLVRIATTGLGIKAPSVPSGGQARYQLHLFVAALLLQAMISVGAVVLYDVPVSTETDSVEYITTAENVLRGNGFSIEHTAPWRPNAYRTPGPLLTNIPLRILSFNSDVLAIIISRLILLGAALLVIRLASQLGLSSFAFLAGTFFVLMPSIGYYTILPYSTETPYSAACGLLFVATLAYLTQDRWEPLMLIGLAAMYALYLRPAALVVLIGYIVAALLIGLTKICHGRWRLFLAAGSCLAGVLIAYGTWAYRNYTVFGAFQYTAVAGHNLLHWNASGMEPHLDETGKKELRTSLLKHPTFLQRYSGFDQFVVANEQGKEGMRLILKYPLPFIRSHLEGTVQSFFVFTPSMLKSHSPTLMIAASVLHCLLALMGIVGLAASWRSFSDVQRISLGLMLTVGVASILTGGAFFSPRFRIPLDLLFAVGCALFVMRVMRQRDILHGLPLFRS